MALTLKGIAQQEALFNTLCEDFWNEVKAEVEACQTRKELLAIIDRFNRDLGGYPMPGPLHVNFCFAMDAVRQKESLNG